MPVYFCGRDFSGAGLYAGAGYGCRELYWQDIENRWARVTDRSWKGLVPEAGAVFVRNCLFISAGVSVLCFAHLDLEIAAGLRF